MHWAKTQSQATYNLALSDIAHYPLADLIPADPREFPITGPGGYGYPPLIRAIAQRYEVPEECVVLSVGTSLANQVAMGALVDPGDEVVIEQPTYELLTSALRYLGAHTRFVGRKSENNFRLDLEELQRVVSDKTKLIVVTNLHNPSSALLDEETLRGIGTIAERAGACVLVDEVYLDAIFSPRPRSAVHLGKQFVTTSSLTKVYGLSGLRCGWILAAPETAEKMRRLSDLFHSSHVHIAERLSVTAFEHSETILERSRKLLEANTQVINDFFASRKDLISVPHRFGLVAFPRFREPIDDHAFCAYLKSAHDTSAVPGTFFGMPHHIRIGIGREPAILQEGLRRLGLALDEKK
jgi:aspartate/methionine/tyrosine aminotransferase